MFTCRICRMPGAREAMIAPCACRGSVALVHRECLDTWQRTRYEQHPATSFVCELCGSDFNLDYQTIGGALRFLYRGLVTLVTITLVRGVAPVYGYLLAAYFVVLLHRMPAWPSRELFVNVYREELWPFIGIQTRLFLLLVVVSYAYAPFVRVRTWVLRRAYTPLPVVDTGYTPEEDVPETTPPAANTRSRTRAAATAA